MPKYKVTKMTVTATHNAIAELIVTGSEINGTECVSFKVTDKKLILTALSIYMNDPDDDRVSTFEGEYMEIESKRAFVRYGTDDSGNKMYCPM